MSPFWRRGGRRPPGEARRRRAGLSGADRQSARLCGNPCLKPAPRQDFPQPDGRTQPGNRRDARAESVAAQFHGLRTGKFGDGPIADLQRSRRLLGKPVLGGGCTRFITQRRDDNAGVEVQIQ